MQPNCASPSRLPSLIGSHCYMIVTPRFVVQSPNHCQSLPVMVCPLFVVGLDTLLKTQVEFWPSLLASAATLLTEPVFNVLTDDILVLLVQQSKFSH
jgi:hypothetical protein